MLPSHYLRKDVTFNMQRVALLTYALGQDKPDAGTIYQAMQDRIHQPYRQELIHGLETLRQLTPESTEGLLGICLSGAGPSILVLATHKLNEVARKVVAIVGEAEKEQPVRCEWEILEVAEQGASVEYEGKWSGIGKIGKFLSKAVRSRV